MTPDEIPKIYEPQKVESDWSEAWIKRGIFTPNVESEKKSFVIVIPPPNVTGSLHMGHALNNTLQDILIRWKKMSGFETLWVPGTDHGGIATQNVVEKLLKQEKKSRYDIGREKFLEKMWQWRKESGDTILMQLRRLGCSLDWSRTRFTMDEVCSKAVFHAFVELYKKGWIYRGKRMVNWCVRCQTALSDIEVEYEERKDHLYYLRYPILSGARDGWQGVPLIVATTRPETMLGDAAVAVHPEDPRYEKIHGWWVQLPIVEKEIAIVSDRAVDPKFGTGVVKVTPAHDPADFEMGERHHLAQEAVIGVDGKMTESAGKYKGLSREECRKQIVQDLKNLDLIEKIEDYTHSVGVCYRCGVVVEPLVSDQWFLNTDEMAKGEAGAIQATVSGAVNFFPESWKQPYLNWLENLRHWCISRQIWWGHRIPIWYCVKSEIRSQKQEAGGNILHPSSLTACRPIASMEKPQKCPQCGNEDLDQDPDVLDTWFSSALWPFSVLGWPDATKDLKKFYPTSVLVTGHEILYLWVARMVMFGLTFNPKQAEKMEEKIPYSHVFIHGIVRDKQGRKMSKSLGNVIDPLTMMEKYGTDALRFVLTSQSVPGRDMQISDDTFVGARNFANKIWNVTRFVLMNLAPIREHGAEGKEAFNLNPQSAIRNPQLELCDQWILSRLQKTISKVNQSLEEYNLAQVSRALYQFVWSEFCDWYIELSKIRIANGENTKAKEAALNICIHILENILHLLHPIMPFITEQLWRNLQTITKQGEPVVPTLLFSAYPRFNAELADEEAEEQMQILMETIVQVRTIRAEMNVPPSKLISVLMNVSEDKKNLFERYGHYVRHLCKIDRLEVGRGYTKPKGSASAVAPGVEIFVPLEGLIDFEKEKQRIQKELDALAADLERIETRLSNPDFRKNAPADEVVRTEQRKEDSAQKLKRLEEHMASMGR